MERTGIEPVTSGLQNRDRGEHGRSQRKSTAGDAVASAGLGFLYAVVGVIALSATLPDPWAADRLRGRVRRRASAFRARASALLGAVPPVAMMSPTALDNDQRSPRELLASFV
jgi:hypothetical protein